MTAEMTVFEVRALGCGSVHQKARLFESRVSGWARWVIENAGNDSAGDDRRRRYCLLDRRVRRCGLCYKFASLQLTSSVSACPWTDLAMRIVGQGFPVLESAGGRVCGLRAVVQVALYAALGVQAISAE